MLQIFQSFTLFKATYYKQYVHLDLTPFMPGLYQIDNLNLTSWMPGLYQIHKSRGPIRVIL